MEGVCVCVCIGGEGKERLSLLLSEMIFLSMLVMPHF